MNLSSTAVKEESFLKTLEMSVFGSITKASIIFKDAVANATPTSLLFIALITSSIYF